MDGSTRAESTLSQATSRCHIQMPHPDATPRCHTRCYTQRRDKRTTAFRRGIQLRFARTKRNNIINILSPTRALRDPFTCLPPEIGVNILGYLSDFSTLLSTILTHRAVRDLYHAFDRQILLAIFHRQCSEVRGFKIGQPFWSLVFAIRHDIVKRAIAEELFVAGWQIFQKRNLEELLLPLGGALAWSYCLDNREKDAVNFLEELWSGSERFVRESRPLTLRNGMYREELQQMWPKATLSPIRQLLDKLGVVSMFKDAKELDDFRFVLGEEICVAEIQEESLRVFLSSMSAGCTIERLGQGIHFCGGRAFVGLVDPGRIPLCKSWKDREQAASKGKRCPLSPFHPLSQPLAAFDSRRRGGSPWIGQPAGIWKTWRGARPPH